MCRPMITITQGISGDDIHINPEDIVVVTGKEYSFTIMLRNGLNITIENNALSKDAFLDVWRKTS